MTTLQVLECVGKFNMQKEFLEHTTGMVKKKPNETISIELAEQTLDEEECNTLDGIIIEKLYSEVLYKVLHPVAYMDKVEDRNVIFSYVQEAFHLDSKKHETMLEEVQKKEVRRMTLNILILEAKDLPPTDSNGFSDPFCILYLASAPKHCYSTSFKERTLNPVWEESIALSIDDQEKDVLHLEIWDFDPSEYVTEKILKIKDVDGIKMVGKYIQEFASYRKNLNELIGRVSIPLKNLHANSQILTFNLDGASKIEGSVRIRANFCSQEDVQQVIKEYRYLLRVFAKYEIKSLQIKKEYEWNGEFCVAANNVLQQHAGQSGMTQEDEALSKWVEYASINLTHPVSYHAFHTILKKLTKPIANGLLSKEDIKTFWNSAVTVILPCLNTIRGLRKLPHSEKRTIITITEALNILSTVSKVHQPAVTDLFPPSATRYLDKMEQNCDIRSILKQIIEEAAIQWFNRIANYKPEGCSKEDRIIQQIKVIDIVKADLKISKDVYHDLFMTALQIPYAEIVYTVYQKEVNKIAKPLLEDICTSMKPLQYKEYLKSSADHSKNVTLDLFNILYELFVSLQRFVKLGKRISGSEENKILLSEFHNCFYQGVDHWLDLAKYKTMHYIERAVEQDKLTAIDYRVKSTSSSLDTLCFYYEIKRLWDELSFPDVEKSYMFLTRFLLDICSCFIYYADLMVLKIETLIDNITSSRREFKITNEWCYAINSLEYVQRSIQPFANDLGLADIVKTQPQFKGSFDALDCIRALEGTINNAAQSIRDMMLFQMEAVAEEIKVTSKEILMKEDKSGNSKRNSLEKLMKCLDNNLSILSLELNSASFHRTLQNIYHKLLNTVLEFLESGLETKRTSSFFVNLNKTLQVLKSFFNHEEISEDNNETLAHIEHLLILHGMKTSNLIMQVHLNRLDEQRQMIGAPNGMLTVRLQFVCDLLKIEILNGRNIKAMDNNGFSDPYVEIILLPEEMFNGISQYRTKTQKRTLFPLFDEEFLIDLTKQQRLTKNAMVLFKVMDEDFYGVRNEFLGEAYYPFSEIPSSTTKINLHYLEQTHLTLSKPTNFDSDAITILHHRTGEKLAQRFIERQKLKQNPKLS